MLAMMVANLLQVALWGGLFVLLGEFEDLYAAIYHSAVNFTSLGYGDVVMDAGVEASRPPRGGQRRAHDVHDRRSPDGHPAAHGSIPGGRDCRGATSRSRLGGLTQLRYRVHLAGDLARLVAQQEDHRRRLSCDAYACFSMPVSWLRQNRAKLRNLRTLPAGPQARATRLGEALQPFNSAVGRCALERPPTHP